MAEEATFDPQTGETVKPERKRNPDGTYAPENPPQETSAAAPPEAAPVPKHPAYLVEAAESFGFSQDEIDNLPSDQLSAHVWRIQRNQERLRADFERERAIQGAAGTSTPAAPTPPSEPQDDLGLGDMAEALDPRIVSLLKSQHQTIKELKQGFEGVQKAEQQRALMSNADIFDDAFESLGEQYAKVFGSGPGMEMQKDDPAFKRRRAAIQNSGATDADSPRIKKRKIMQAAVELFGAATPPAEAANDYDKIPVKNGKAKPRITQEQWDTGGVAVPTARKTDDMPLGERRAVENLAKKMGVPAGSAGISEDMGLLK